MKAFNPSTNQWEDVYVKALDSFPVGVIVEYPTTDTAKLPTGYMFCDGSAISRTDYSELFALIGTSFGAGDGSTTFNLPSKKGLVTVGINSSDTNFNTIGKTGGEKTHTLTVQEMPSHNHKAPLDGGNQQGDWLRYGGSSNVMRYYVNTQNVGGGQAHNNLQPYVVSNFIIKVKPTRALAGNIVNAYSENQNSAYSAEYANNNFQVNGTILYNDATGTKNNITLSDSLANYSIIDITFKNTDGNIYYTNRYYDPNGRTIAMFYNNIGSSARYLFEKRYSCSGTSINKTSCYQYNGASNAYGTYDSFNIVKVVGYK